MTLVHKPLESIVAYHKTPTTRNVTEGIKTAIEEVLKQSNVDSKNVLSVTIGTTHFINAVVEADTNRLAKVAVLRLCGPYTMTIPPFCDLPEPLKGLIYGYHALLNGGFEGLSFEISQIHVDQSDLLTVDGREISGIDEGEVFGHCEHIAESKDIFNIVICGVFSPLDANGSQERRVASIVGDFFKKAGSKVNVVCSSDGM
jgi:N-methylhydantoinase A/oxoprolinase/acetone carboxylase beta subunit